MESVTKDAPAFWRARAGVEGANYVAHSRYQNPKDRTASTAELEYVKRVEAAYIASKLWHEAYRNRDSFCGGLDFGTGVGRFISTLEGVSDCVVGADINDAAEPFFRERNPGVEFVLLEPGKPLPFPDKHFDLVTTFTVLQHIPPETFAAVLPELARVLEPGGCWLSIEAGDDHEWQENAEVWRRNYPAVLEPYCIADLWEPAVWELWPGAHHWCYMGTRRPR